MTPEEYVNSLIQISTEKMNIMKEILILTKKQDSIISEDSVAELQGVIDNKQIHIDKIDKLDEKFDVYFSRLKSVLGIDRIDQLKAEELKGAHELIRIITTIVDDTKSIQNIEKSNSIRANKVLEKLGDEIKKVNQSKTVNNGYNIGTKTSQTSYFFDTKK